MIDYRRFIRSQQSRRCLSEMVHTEPIAQLRKPYHLSLAVQSEFATKSFSEIDRPARPLECYCRRLTNFPVDPYHLGTSPRNGRNPFQDLRWKQKQLKHSSTIGHPIGLVTGSPNMSRKVDWRRVSSWARASRRLVRKASAASRILAIRFCSASGGRGISVSFRYL